MATARKAAVKAARAIVEGYGITGVCDPGYIASIIEAELLRFEADPDAPIVERPWKGPDVTTGLSMAQLEAAAAMTHGGPAARSAAISIARSYASVLESRSRDGTIGTAVADIAGLIETNIAKGGRFQAASTGALAEINRHRSSLGMPPLDPVASGWEPEDIETEAERIREIKSRMLSWY